MADTCDIYHYSNTPPAAPDIAGVPGTLVPAWQRGLESGEGKSGDTLYTHVLWLDLSVDIRDGGRVDSATVVIANTDKVWIPDQNGTKFFVLWVERVGNQKRVYLQRDDGANLTWPNSNL